MIFFLLLAKKYFFICITIDHIRYKVGGASKPSPWLCGMGPPDCYGDQRLRPLPNNSECEPKRTNSIALLFLSNQIKSVSFSIWHSI